MGRSQFLSRTAGALSALGLALGPVQAAADEKDYPGQLVEAAQGNDKVVVLEPVSPWNIDFAENRCRLSRVFGSAEDMHLLFFEQAAPQGAFGLTVAGSEVRRIQRARGLYLGMQSDAPMDEVERAGIGDVDQVGPAVIISGFTINPEGFEDDANENEVQVLRKAGIDLEEAAKVDRVVFQRGSRVLSFETDNMMAPFQAMNVCTGDLLRAWGLDQASHESYMVPVWTNQDAIVRRIVDEYPDQALRRGEQGIFRMRVIVETDGTVSDCHLEKSTETEKLESPACRAMMDALFEPARDAGGNAMRSFYATTVTYSIN